MSQVKLLSSVRTIPELDDGWDHPNPASRLEEMRERGRAFHEAFVADGPVSAVATLDLSFLPYPVAYGFWHAPPVSSRWLIMRNRMNVVEYEDFDGARRVLLVNPSEHDLSAAAGFFVEARKDLHLGFLTPERLKKLPGPATLLERRGLDPARVDYITFDHLHVQDLRRSLGSLDGGPLYPNAKLLVNRRELETVASPHPLQRPWYIGQALDGVPADRIVSLDGSAWLGKGVALVWTPGHTRGNHSILIHVEGRGAFAISENGISVDSYAPERSRIRSLRELSERYGAEVVLNGNTLEQTMDQYTSMVLEKSVASSGDAGEGLPNIFSSSPFVRTLSAKHVVPTFKVAPLERGTFSAARG